jgi:two-component system OmpR family response regulator
MLSNLITDMKKKNPNEIADNGWGGRVVRTILVVDDNQHAAYALAALLENDGYDVALAHDGETAMAIAEDVSPEVIILDVNLPGKNGYEIARLLRQKKSRALLIALTGYYGRKEDKVRARAAGFDHYLVRPILATEIEKLFSAPK